MRVVSSSVQHTRFYTAADQHVRRLLIVREVVGQRVELRGRRRGWRCVPVAAAGRRGFGRRLGARTGRRRGFGAPCGLGLRFGVGVQSAGCDQHAELVDVGERRWQQHALLLRLG